MAPGSPSTGATSDPRRSDGLYALAMEHASLPFARTGAVVGCALLVGIVMQWLGVLDGGASRFANAMAFILTCALLRWIQKRAPAAATSLGLPLTVLWLVATLLYPFIADGADGADGDMLGALLLVGPAATSLAFFGPTGWRAGRDLARRRTRYP